MFEFFDRFRKKDRLLAYKVWLENDGKPLPRHYARTYRRRKPYGAQAFLWTSQQETQDLLDKYKDRFPVLHQRFWAPDTWPVMRSDMIRLLILYDRGGVYSDFDAVWTRKHLPDNYDVILWTEFTHTDESVRKNMEFTREYRGDVPEFNVRIANYIMYVAKPGSALLARCLHRIERRLEEHGEAPFSSYGVLYTTGPDVVTDTAVEGVPDLAILQPYKARETTNAEWTDKDGERVLLLGRQPGKAIARHEMHGFWRPRK